MNVPKKVLVPFTIVVVLAMVVVAGVGVYNSGACSNAFDYHAEQAAYYRGYNNTTADWHDAKADAYERSPMGMCPDWEDFKEIPND